jgi:hypothetical protein
VPPTRNRDYFSIFARGTNYALHIFQRSWL